MSFYARRKSENQIVRMKALTNFHDLFTAFEKDGSGPASPRRLAELFTDVAMLSSGK